MTTTQAVVGDREQRVGVWRQVNAHDIGFLVGNMVDKARILMREAVVVLAPNVRCEQIVERGDGLAPGNRTRGFQPFRMLIEHGIDDVNEGFVAGKKTVAASQEIALKPAFAHMLAENFHNASISGQVFINRQGGGFPGLAGDIEKGIQAVGSGLVRTEDAEIACLEVALHDVAQIAA
jgi:hypothetical protein